MTRVSTFLVGIALFVTAVLTVKAMADANQSLDSRSHNNQPLYVSTTGDDANPGSEVNPFRTLQHAAAEAKPGETINVRAGSYCERLTVRTSGNDKRYITFRSQPGELAVLDGSCLTPGLGDSAMILLHNVSYIQIQGLEIRNYKTADRLRAPAGIRIDGSGSHIRILGNDVHDIQQTYPGRESSGHGANGFGIAVYGTDAGIPISDLIIDGNQVHHLQTGSSESLVLNGNVTNFQVTRNRVHHNNNIGIDIIGFEHTAPNPKVDRARDGIVRQNEVYDITSEGNPAYGDEVSSDGIYVDGGTRVIIEDNIIHNVDFGIELASEHRVGNTSHITARNNLIYFCHTAGISIGGYDAQRGTTEDSAIVNNTLYQNDAWGTKTGEFQMQFYLRNNTFADNIVYVGDSGRALNSRTSPTDNNTPTVRLDHNVYYSVHGSHAVKWSYDGKDYAGFEDYVRATGEDQHSSFADPKFVRPSRNDFHLQPDSQALGKGSNIARQTKLENLPFQP